MLGRTGRRARRTVGLFFLAVFNEYRVRAYFHNAVYGQKYFLTGKLKTLTSRNGKSRHLVFGKGKGQISNSAEMLAVYQVYYVLLFQGDKRNFHNITI